MATHHVIVHGIEHARLALAEAQRRGDQVVIHSAGGAALYAGAAWFRELEALVSAEYPEVLHEAILDCGEAPGIALGALRCGVRTISLKAPAEVRDKVAAVAQQVGARLVPRPTCQVLDLAAQTDTRTAIRRWFAKEEL